MASEVQVVIWCDPCLKDAQEKVAAVWEDMVSVGKVGRLVALCEEHAEKLGLAGLADWLKSYGGPARDPGVKAGQLQLPVSAGQVTPLPHLHPNATAGKELHSCTVCGRSYSQRTSLNKHLKDEHQTSLRELEGKAPRPLETCPWCGEEFVRGTGMAAHKRQTHGHVVQGGAPLRPDELARLREAKANGVHVVAAV